MHDVLGPLCLLSQSARRAGSRCMLMKYIHTVAQGSERRGGECVRRRAVLAVGLQGRRWGRACTRAGCGATAPKSGAAAPQPAPSWSHAAGMLLNPNIVGHPHLSAVLYPGLLLDGLYYMRIARCSPSLPPRSWYDP